MNDLRRVGAFRLLILILLMGLCPGDAAGLDLTAGLIFDQMEERTGQIDSLQADLIMSSGPVSSRVSMAIQSPDKFSMDFVDRSVRVVFDGEKLWIYLQELQEVFTLDAASQQGWISDYLRDWVNPKKIVTQITRQTLFTFFDVQLLSEPAQTGTGASAPLQIFPLSGHRMRFTPLGSTLFKKVFGVSYYDMVFSKESFLPVMVAEYEPEAKLRGVLTVLEYRINQEIPRSAFEFTVPAGVKEVPLIEVIKQKLEQEKDAIVERLGTFLDSALNKVNFWGSE